jgi:hypothetical protein
MLKKIYVVAILGALLVVSQAALFSAPAPAAAQAKEQHPHMRAAIQELRAAKQELQTAAHDFGGHRNEAIESVGNAMKQLQLALQYDKK